MIDHKITIVDYGVGNLYSVKRALEYCGASNVCISSSPYDIIKADKVILPGVGAFADGMHGLSERNLIDPILSYASSGKPLLGICLGMQLFSSIGNEFGSHEGLNLIPGKVVAIPTTSLDNESLKSPYVGWSSLDKPIHSNWNNTIFYELNEKDSFYLVHSYHYVPTNLLHVTATYQYGDHIITAAINFKNIYGLQFHPEKSGPSGLKILHSFITMGNRPLEGNRP